MTSLQDLSAPPGLDDIQKPVQEQLDGVVDELRRIIVSDFDLIQEVNQYLLLLQGKLLRPALLLLSNRVCGPQDPRAIRLAAMMPVLVEQDRLNRYADFAFTCRAIEGLGRRLSGPNRLAELVPWLEEDYERLARDFERLWPAVNDALGIASPQGGITRP